MQNANLFPCSTCRCSRRCSLPRGFWLTAFSFLLLPTPTIHAQEAVRMSLAGAEAAEARRKVANTPDYFNLKLGPTTWNFSSGLGAEYNDNVGLNQDTNRQSDVIFRPQLNTRMLWPVTEQN